MESKIKHPLFNTGINKGLKSYLNVLKSSELKPGINKPFLYVSTAGSLFPVHR